MNLDEIRQLYPYADTIEKAESFISCAAKQGRSDIMLRMPNGVREQLYNRSLIISIHKYYYFDDGSIKDTLCSVSWSY